LMFRPSLRLFVGFFGSTELAAPEKVMEHSIDAMISGRRMGALFGKKDKNSAKKILHTLTCLGFGDRS